MFVRSARRAAAQLVLVAAFFVGIISWSSSAQAYPWMIRHPYTSCAVCHADPSGAGLLTEYGRAQSEILLRTHYSGKPDADPGTIGNFMFGVPTPDWLLLGGAFRQIFVVQLAPPLSAGASRVSYYQMQGDLRAQVTASRFRANGSVAFIHDGARGAQITTNATDNLVSRDHWLGVDIGSDKEFLLRAGRIMVPFGIRSVEHTLWTRKATRTDINATQQHGVALSYVGEKFHGEVMAIAGNYQLNPDAYRERGYSLYGEYHLGEHSTVGLSSMITHASSDLDYNEERTRQAHGLFTRFAAVEKIVVMAEADALIQSLKTEGTLIGFTGYAQVDLEATQGVHFGVTAEGRYDGQCSTCATGNQFKDTKPMVGGWLTFNWFFLPHMDIRIDGLSRLIYGPYDAAGANKYITDAAIDLQYHLFL